jgi:hypothetical protein
MNQPEFEFKPHQVNNSSQSNQVTDHLISLEEGKPQIPTKGTKSGKAKQNDKEELRKA